MSNATETRGVLAGAYRGKRASLAEALTHTVYVTPAAETTACGRVNPDHLADTYAQDVKERPTCTPCLARDPRFR